MAASEWNSTTPPNEHSVVYVLAEDDHGPYELPFLVVFRDDCWWNAHTGEELEAFVAGWRPFE